MTEAMVDVVSGSGRDVSAMLAAVPRELRPQFRRALKETAEDVKTVAAGNASWSSRIPGSLVTRVNFAARNPAVRVVARRSVAPHARAYEGIRGSRTFRHPVFGNREEWVAEATRPFLAPAARSQGPAALRRVETALDKAAARAGFRITT